MRRQRHMQFTPDDSGPPTPEGLIDAYSIRDASIERERAAEGYEGSARTSAGATVETRLAVPEDAPLLAELGARTFHAAFASDNSLRDMQAYLASAFGVDVIRDELTDPSTPYLITCAGDTLLGYAKVRFSDPPECVEARRPVELVRIYADTDRIGQGVGSTLMSGCLDLASQKECDVLWLGVWERNERAIAFYEKWGFRSVGDHQFLLGEDSQTDIVMARTVEAG